MLARGEIPQSVCSLPCGLGEIKSFEVRHPAIFKSNLQLKSVDHKFVNGKRGVQTSFELAQQFKFKVCHRLLNI
jgi:hypothetical protein